MAKAWSASNPGCARRRFRVHLRRGAGNRTRHHARQLPDAGRRRHALRRADRRRSRCRCRGRCTEWRTYWPSATCRAATTPLQRLLEKIRFDPAADRLWFCGDLVNRGGQSLETLRLVHSLRASTARWCSATTTCRCWPSRSAREADQRKVNPDLQGVLFAPDRDDLIDWLRQQKLLHVDRELGSRWCMPAWRRSGRIEARRGARARSRGATARRRLPQAAAATCTATSRPGRRNCPAPSASAPSSTCSRACATARRAAASASRKRADPARRSPGLYPWFEVPGHAARDLPIVCGHWSTLGLFMGLGVYAIDTGAVWGGKLTALELGPNCACTRSRAARWPPAKKPPTDPARGRSGASRDFLRPAGNQRIRTRTHGVRIAPHAPRDASPANRAGSRTPGRRHRRPATTRVDVGQVACACAIGKVSA